MAAEAGIVEEVVGGGLAGEEQDAALGAELADADGGLDAVHAGHDDVGEEEVGKPGLGGLDGLIAAVNGGYLVTTAVEDDAQGIGDDAFVIGNKDSGAHGGCSVVGHFF